MERGGGHTFFKGGGGGAVKYPVLKCTFVNLFAKTYINSLLANFFRYMPLLLRGKGGVPGGQIMENEFEYLTDRGGYGDHLAEKFLKKYCS